MLFYDKYKPINVNVTTSKRFEARDKMHRPRAYLNL